MDIQSILLTPPHPQPVFPQDADANVMESRMIAVKFMTIIWEYCDRAQDKAPGITNGCFSEKKEKKARRRSLFNILYYEDNERKIHPVWRVITDIMHKADKPIERGLSNYCPHSRIRPREGEAQRHARHWSLHKVNREQNYTPFHSPLEQTERGCHSNRSSLLNLRTLLHR